VSHDRDLLDNVVTSSLVLAGGGRVDEYVGGYSDWLRQRSRTDCLSADRLSRERPSTGPGAASARGPAGEESSADAERSADAKAKSSTPKKGTPKPNKLSYKDQRALEQLPQQIEALEGELEQLHARLGDPALYQGPADAVMAARSRLAEVEAELAECYDRWEALEAAQEALR
jgi:ATP-binding cassette subfamily F protein uup